TVPKLLALVDAVEACPLLDSVWAGDALFANRQPAAEAGAVTLPDLADHQRRPIGQYPRG
ncbi:MAG TPA: hypothetical protein VIG49_06455, partial [Acetobacteraceae bacterium]